MPKVRLDTSARARLTAAVAFAAKHHAAQKRKETDIPYLSHLLQVAGLVLEHGGTIDQAIAGLLHDAVEDCPDVTVRQLRETFGARVAAIVADCTDATHADKRSRSLSWKERKLRYLAHLADSSDASVLVVACDKRQNLGALVGDVRVHGVGYLRRFNSTPQQQVWYYASVLRAIGRRIPARLRAEMEIALADFRRLLRR
jgi:(p)ppGpp synthase/HD superfamily hydrolase